MQAFLNAWLKTGREEGGYVNNPHDKGGPTNFGITEVVARANGYRGDMRDLTQAQARQIAYKQYWQIMRLDDVAALSVPIAEEMFDTGFNCGQGNSAKFLQRALNRFNRSHRKEGPDYPELAEDGIVGPMTIYSLRLFLERRKKAGELVMLRALNSLQGAYYISITPAHSPNEEFAFGWFANRVRIPGETL
jgi:lysozyme family protein